ncbi:hypothetical protein P9112_009199 [Eukaryota sp. TZLM1-RC]
MNESDPRSRWCHLVQPFKDLADNWNINIDKELENYMDELDAISQDTDNDIDFAHAAVVLQGSSNIYSRKVEFLHHSLYDILENIDTGVPTKQKPSRSRRNVSFSNELCCDQDIPVAKASDITISPQEESELLITGFFSHTEPRLPLNSNVVDADDGPSPALLNTFLSSLAVSDSGELALESWDDNVLLPIISNEGSFIQRSISDDNNNNDFLALHEPLFNDDLPPIPQDDVVDDGFDDVAVDDVVGEGDLDEGMAVVENQELPNLESVINQHQSISDFWTDSMNPDEESSLPLTKPKPFKPLDESKYLTPPNKNKDWLAPFDIEPETVMTCDDVININSLQPLIDQFVKKKRGDLVESMKFQDDDVDSDSGDEGQSSQQPSQPMNQSFNQSFNQSMDHNQSFLFNEPKVEDFITLANQQMESNTSYLNQKVNQWHEQVNQILNHQSNQKPFVVDEYRSVVISKVVEKENQVSDVIGDENSFEVARNFATFLQLINDGEVVCEKDAQNNLINIIRV